MQYPEDGLTFSGSLAPGAATMTFDTYGSGALPVISGGVESNAWVDAGSGRFYISGVTVKPKVVVINGRQYARGRTPDNGFWNQDAVTSGGGNATVTANELSGFNWTGATIVHRPERWIINNETITAHTGSVIDFSYLYYAPKQDYKFFITDDLDCVTAYGEWYWDDATDRLYVYFGSSGTSPVTYSVTNNPLLVIKQQTPH